MTPHPENPRNHLTTIIISPIHPYSYHDPPVIHRSTHFVPSSECCSFYRPRLSGMNCKAQSAGRDELRIESHHGILKLIICYRKAACRSRSTGHYGNVNANSLISSSTTLSATTCDWDDVQCQSGIPIVRPDLRSHLGIFFSPVLPVPLPPACDAEPLAAAIWLKSGGGGRGAACCNNSGNNGALASDPIGDTTKKNC